MREKSGGEHQAELRRGTVSLVSVVLKMLEYYVGRVGTVAFLVVVPLITLGIATYMTWNWLVSWQDMVLLGVMYMLVSFGVTIGYHRYLTHMGFKTNRVVKCVLVILGTMGWQGGAVSWVANHRLHHAYSDEEGDIHSPQLSKNLVRGFFHAQIGWLLRNKRADPEKWAKDLLRDKDVLFIQRTALFLVRVESGDTTSDRRLERVAVGWPREDAPGAACDILGELGVPSLWKQSLRDQGQEHQPLVSRVAGYG